MIKKEKRRAKGLKVTDISDFMGFESPQAVYKWQRGDSLPDLGNMVRLCQLFKISDFREIIVTTESADEALPFLRFFKSVRYIIKAGFYKGGWYFKYAG